MHARRRVAVATAAFAFAAMAVSGQAVATPSAPNQGPGADAAQVAAYWTAAKRASAIPRDITVDASGRSFIGSGANLKPYGSGARVPAPTLVADAPQQRAGGPKGGGSSDTTAPVIAGLNPAAGATVTTSSVVFSATVTDEGSGIKSVAFVIRYPDGRTQSFSPGSGANNVWTITLNGFTDSPSWSWQVVAKDNGSRGGNTAESAWTGFTVDQGGTTPPPPASDDVANDPWTADSAVRTASGRLLFEMPTNKRGNRLQAYVCSATVVDDGSTGDANSLLLTAAHCVYDEGSGFFASNVLFIPDQQGTTTGARTDSDCTNDPIGCWAPTFGVVDEQWTTNAWPANIPWDYGYYVVPNTGSHTWGLDKNTTDALEQAVTPMNISFSNVAPGGASAFGYSYSEDPKLMYCAQARGYTGGTSADASDNWWLDQCGLTGGASGGPWLDQYPATGDGSIISVNSWGYSNQPGMAGPKLDDSNSTSRLRPPVCVYNVATGVATENTKVTSC